MKTRLAITFGIGAFALAGTFNAGAFETIAVDFAWLGTGTSDGKGGQNSDAEEQSRRGKEREGGPPVQVHAVTVSQIS